MVFRAQSGSPPRVCVSSPHFSSPGGFVLQTREQIMGMHADDAVDMALDMDEFRYIHNIGQCGGPDECPICDAECNDYMGLR